MTRPVMRALKVLLTAAPWSFVQGTVLAVVVLAAGAGLLGLSGWFITATGIAGLAGLGIAFDTFRPSAGIRLLALGRTAARYGERLVTHEATLRALAALRVDVLRGLTRRDAQELARMRSETALTRITADVDALDSLILRLLLPGIAAVLTYGLSGLVLAGVAGTGPALVVLVGTLPLAGLILWRLARRADGPSEAAETEAQALRRGVIDASRDRTALILAGLLPDRRATLMQRDALARAAARELDRVERVAGLRLSFVLSAVTAAALMAGAVLVDRGTLDPARAAVALFVAMALAEPWPALRRGLAEFGRAKAAAGRLFAEPPRDAGGAPAARARGQAQPLRLEIERPGVSLTLEPGQAVALTGSSGVGKTQLLNRIAGVARQAQGIVLNGEPVTTWSEEALRDTLTLVPQRSVLLAGSIRDNLNLATATPASDEVLWRMLEAVALADVLRSRDGLDTRLSEGGAGLSGGETRRLALARAMLRRPALLLLDEPTEGLDAATADAVLTNLRAALPETAILAALHRGESHAIFATRITLSK